MQNQQTNTQTNEQLAAQMAETWARLASVFPFDKFADRKTAVDLLWQAVKALTQATTHREED
jgi:hypothetical protein